MLVIYQESFKDVYSLKWNFRSAHDTITNTVWQLPEVVLIQLVSPDDEHCVLETRRELQIKKINT